MKVLNLYAGIGGNRKLWTDCEVTAVEYEPKIAAIYTDLYPNDTVIVGDAHQYLLDHYKEFDFIWASPPCQTHSRTNYFLNARGVVRYPDMKLYQEILFLRTFYEGLFCVENVKPYYAPLINPVEINRHLFWANFEIPKILHDNVSIGKMCGPNQTQRIKNIETVTTERYDINISKYDVKNKQQIIRNMVSPEIGLAIYNAAKGIIESRKIKQSELF